MKVTFPLRVLSDEYFKCICAGDTKGQEDSLEKYMLCKLLSTNEKHYQNTLKGKIFSIYQKLHRIEFSLQHKTAA